MNQNIDEIKVEFCEDSMREEIYFKDQIDMRVKVKEEINFDDELDEHNSFETVDMCLKHSFSDDKIKQDEIGEDETVVDSKSENVISETCFEKLKSGKIDEMCDSLPCSSSFEFLAVNKVEQEYKKEIERNEEELDEFIESECSEDEGQKKTKIFCCDECNYKSICRPHLRRHINSVHLRLKPFSCSQCDYKTTQKATLNAHINSMHLKLKCYQCLQCDYKTGSKKQVKKHFDAIHSKLKEFKCSKCEYEACEKRHLKLHFNRVHLNLFPFICSYCEYKTDRKSNLDIHIKSVHLDIREYKCSQCGYAAYTKTVLNRHVKRNHLSRT